MQELLLAGEMLSQQTLVGLSSCAGGGEQEQEVSGPQHTASSPQGLTRWCWISQQSLGGAGGAREGVISEMFAAGGAQVSPGGVDCQ